MGVARGRPRPEPGVSASLRPPAAAWQPCGLPPGLGWARRCLRLAAAHGRASRDCIADPQPERLPLTWLTDLVLIAPGRGSDESLPATTGVNQAASVRCGLQLLPKST